MKYFMSADVTFFEFIPYFFPQGPVTVSESIPFSSSVLLFALAHVSDASSPVSSTDTIELSASKPLRYFRHLYTHRPKFLPLNQFQPIPPLQWKVLISHQHLPLFLMFLLPSVKVNGPALIILFLISFPMIVLIPFFASSPCLCLLSLFLGLMRGQYCHQPRTRLWMRR